MATRGHIVPGLVLSCSARFSSSRHCELADRAEAQTLALSSYSRHSAAGVESARDPTDGHFGRASTHAATANAVVSETTSHSRQRRRITVR
jgi:hypothetical protein